MSTFPRSRSASAVTVLWRFECSFLHQRAVVEQRTGKQFLKQTRLLRLKGYEPAENVEKVDQVAGVFVRPVIRLDVAEGRRRPAVADDRARAVTLARRTYCC